MVAPVTVQPLLVIQLPACFLYFLKFKFSFFVPYSFVCFSEILLNIFLHILRWLDILQLVDVWREVLAVQVSASGHLRKSSKQLHLLFSSKMEQFSLL
jgi:hypothetical protein